MIQDMKKGMLRLKQTIKPGWISLLSVAMLSACSSEHSPETDADSIPGFTLEILDESGPRAPWGKTLGDINGDGLTDVVVGGHQSRPLTLSERVLRKLGLFERTETGGELVWYQNPTWERHTITEAYKVRTDIEVTDLDQDGQSDIVLVSDQGVIWLDGPDWTPHVISPLLLHDIAIEDMDADGDPDLVGRNQSLFDHNDGDRVHVFLQNEDHGFTRRSVRVPHGEGLAIADMDQDGLNDIVVNQQWLKNPGNFELDNGWATFDYALGWDWPDVFIDVADMNQDGHPDIILSPAEEVGEYYRLSWFEAPATNASDWQEHVIAPRVEAVHHSVAAGDLDRDGRIDVVTAEMNQGDGANPVTAYFNREDGWHRSVISNRSSHSMRAADIDNDFDIDLMGTNWQIQGHKGGYPVYLWRNQLSPETSWDRHVIDEDRPGRALFIHSADLDGDQRPDLITGGYWYRQPSSAGADWTRSPLGETAANALLVRDVDQDGDPDILASGWRGFDQQPSLWRRLQHRLGIKPFPYGVSGADLVWAENDGSGDFRLHNNIQTASGDFQQGVAVLEDANDSTRVLLSWHRPDEGIQSLTLPEQTNTDTWLWERLTPESQDEAITVADLDNDGEDDIVTGTAWLSRDALGMWNRHAIATTEDHPDRHRVIDLNGDGRLDVVVGFEAISEPGDVKLYLQPDSLDTAWPELTLATLIGPMSLDVADMDLDGDTDLLVGEHNLSAPEQARLVWLENPGDVHQHWRPHLIHRGDEHHDGALAIDFDGDGDTDVASIGWGHGKVLLYENPLR